MNKIIDNNPVIYKKLCTYNKLLFVIGTFAVIGGLIFPAVSGLVDILLVFSVSLCLAVILIATCSKQTTELTGFAALAIAATALLLTVNIASSKLILLKTNGSNIINFVTYINMPARILPLWCIAITTMVIILGLFWTILITSKKTIISATEFLEEISAAETEQFEKDYAVVDNETNEAISLKKGYLFSMISFAKFSFCIAFVMCFAAFFIISASFIALSIRATDYSTNPVILSSTCCIFTIFLLFLLSVSVKRLCVKSSEESLGQIIMTENQFTERIKVTAHEIAKEKIIDFEDYNTTKQAIKIEMPDIFFNRQQSLFSARDMDNNSSFEMISNLIQDSCGNKIILMAADNQNNLPVTIPINTSIKLAENNKRTLIIDFDLKRSSVAQVFEIPYCSSKVIKTCIDNLFLFSATKLAETSEQNLRIIFEKLARSFEHIIIYCPDSFEISNRDYFLGHVNSAILFGEADHSFETESLIEKLIVNNCQILQPREIFQLV